MSNFRLKMRDSDITRYLVYNPHTSVCHWEDTLSPIDLSSITVQEKVGKPRPKAHALSPQNPLHKDRGIRNLKIQLGLKCNYSCSYCNQGAQPANIQGKIEDIEPFLTSLPHWFDGGTDGMGAGVNVQFWGGEPFIYWKVLKPLAEQLRTRYPHLHFGVVTNGTLLSDEIIDWLEVMDFSVTISHDGPSYLLNRGSDPLLDPNKKILIQKLYHRLSGRYKINFNCVLTKNSTSFFEVRKYLGHALKTNPWSINLITEELVLPYDNGGYGSSPASREDYEEVIQNLFWDAILTNSLPTYTVRTKCLDFLNSLRFKRPADVLGQKCAMDRIDNLAVDLKGNVLTCQNTSAETQHKIGHVSQFDKIQLNTSRHWSTRKECVKCPVLQLCKGACMYLEGELWEKACDNSFAFNAAMLAVALFWATKMYLVEIEGLIVRREDLPWRIPIVKLDNHLPQKYGALREEVRGLRQNRTSYDNTTI